MVAGVVLVHEGRYPRGDEPAIRRDGAAAIERAWTLVAARGVGRRR
jgi:hypothetical protein